MKKEKYGKKKENKYKAQLTQTQNMRTKKTTKCNKYFTKKEKNKNDIVKIEK